ncbi:MAG: hypothetical protein WB691_01840, partial [Pseudolabrys sp.]
MPTDELALKLEQLLRTPGLHNLVRELEAVGEGRFSESQQPPADFGRLLLNLIKSMASRCERALPH